MRLQPFLSYNCYGANLPGMLRTLAQLYPLRHVRRAIMRAWGDGIITRAEYGQLMEAVNHPPQWVNGAWTTT